MSSDSTGESNDQLSREERSRKWREEHELEPYALEWEDEAVDVEE